MHFGAEKKEISEAFEENYLLRKIGEISTREVAKQSGMSHSTFYRRSKEFEKNFVKNALNSRLSETIRGIIRQSLRAFLD